MTNICIDFTWETALQAANVLVFLHTGEYLSDLETIILHGAWNSYTYEQIAEAEGYTGSYLCRDVGCKLWDNLSTVLKVKVSKTNFKAALRREWQRYTQAVFDPNRNRLEKLLTTENVALFEGLVALSSSCYLERSPIEQICYEATAKPGALIRIEGGKWMGKTSLVKRILEQANLRSQKTVYLDFSSIDKEIIRDIDKLLRWLSIMVSFQLNLENKVKYYCDRDTPNHNKNCTTYFTQQILNEIKDDVVLAFDNIDYLFTHQEVTKKFLKLLRNWHEQAKIDRHWSKLKLVVTQSTNTKIAFNINYLFSNTGTSVLLREFNFQQVKDLADFYQLDWENEAIDRLINEVGGHPYFVRLAMHQAKIRNIALKQ